MMKFLRSFFLTLKGWLFKGETRLGAVVNGNENLSHFIFSKREFSRQPRRVKAEAYMPRKGEVSVFRIDGLGDSLIWRIGAELAHKRKRTLYGRGDTRTRSVRQAGLDVLPAEPPPRHANIVGWPENDKPRQKLLALQLASAATLILNE